MSKEIAKKLKQEFFEKRVQWHQGKDEMLKKVSLHLGWGKLVFGQTCQDDHQWLVDEMLDEPKGQRNIAFYVQEPQVPIFLSKDKIFLNPAYAYRLDLMKYVEIKEKPPCIIRLLEKKDIPAVNLVYKYCKSFEIYESSILENYKTTSVKYFVAEKDGVIIGVVIGIDHLKLLNSPEGSCSLWGLATHQPGERVKGLGTALINAVAEYHMAKGRSYMDLSVDMRNERAIGLYEKLGFKKIFRFGMKCKNELNKGLYYSEDL